MLVDDHELVRTGVKRLLDDAPDVRVVAEASCGEQAVALARETPVDVVLMDVNMPGIGGIEATRKLTRGYPGLKVIVLTIHMDDPFPMQLLKAGAAGYLTKGCRVGEMVEAIRSVHCGRKAIANEVAKRLAETVIPGNDKSVFETLSQREMQVMLMVTQGLKIQQIAERLCLSPKTVSTYRYRLFEKLQVTSDVELTHLAMRHGIMDDTAAVAGE